MSLPAALSIVTLGVADLARSEAFYTALGLERRSSSLEGTIAWFDLGGVYLGLYGAEELAADSGLPAGVARPGEFRGTTLAITVDSAATVDAAVAGATGAGAVVTVAPVMTDYGVYHACFTDPDGHVWEVAHNPGFPIVDGRTVIP